MRLTELHLLLLALTLAIGCYSAALPHFGDGLKEDFGGLAPRTNPDVWGDVGSFAASNLGQGGLHYDVSVTIGPAPGALGNSRAVAYGISRADAVQFIRTVNVQIAAEMAMNPRNAVVPLGWTVPPNNNFRIDLVQSMNPVTGRPFMPLGYFMINQALQNVRQVLNRDPATTITDGQLVIQFFLPRSSSRSVTRPDGTPVATITISRTTGRFAGGASGPPRFLDRLQSTVNVRTRAQILFGDRFAGFGEYRSLPTGP